jgi:hypothetical protein
LRERAGAALSETRPDSRTCGIQIMHEQIVREPADQRLDLVHEGGPDTRTSHTRECGGPMHLEDTASCGRAVRSARVSPHGCPVLSPSPVLPSSRGMIRCSGSLLLWRQPWATDTRDLGGHDPLYRLFMVVGTAMGNRQFGSWSPGRRGCVAGRPRLGGHGGRGETPRSGATQPAVVPTFTPQPIPARSTHKSLRRPPCTLPVTTHTAGRVHRHARCARPAGGRSSACRVESGSELLV